MKGHTAPDLGTGTRRDSLYSDNGSNCGSDGESPPAYEATVHEATQATGFLAGTARLTGMFCSFSLSFFSWLFVLGYT